MTTYDEYVGGIPSYDTEGRIENLLKGKEGIRGWLGQEGKYDILGSKLAGAAIGTGGDPTQINPLKAVAWGSALVAGIQAGKYKDAMEAADAAEDAARGEGVIDEEWIINARREAEEYWNAWSSEVTYEPYTGAEGGRVGYDQGGRIGYRLGEEVQTDKGDIEGQMANGKEIQEDILIQ